MRLGICVILTRMIVAPLALHSQPASSAHSLSFEVASIKLHPGEAAGSMDPSIHGRRVTAVASALLDFIEYAYDVGYKDIAGAPHWAESDRYDLEAKAEGDGPRLTKAEAVEMMRALLADRFQLRCHYEAKDAPIYALVVAKGGPKFKEIPADAKGGGVVRPADRGIHMETTKGTMSQLADQLSFTAGRPVIDQTELKGYYAYTLDWFPANRIRPVELDVPDMFTALQEQLGLKLESSRGPIKILVIDQVEKLSLN